MWKQKSIWIYGGLMGVLIVALQLIEFKYSIRELPTSQMILFIALIFSGLGIWLGIQMSNRKRPEDDANRAHLISKRLEILNISDREYEVLQLISAGHSNQQIADELHISLSTVKSHTSNIFSKMDVSRRTQLVQKARELEILN